jgi:glucosamine--fructose-6-phosphate aminotransferase (isomerizing)
MPRLGLHTEHEIQTQPEAWAAALDLLDAQAAALRDFFRLGRYQAVLFTGCGSTYYAALAAAALGQELSGLPMRGLPASEIWLYPRAAYAAPEHTLLVAVSRSGETTETLRACEAFRKVGGGVITLSCYPATVLAEAGQFNLVLPSGQEESMAQTRAFTTLYLAAIGLTAIWSEQPALLAELRRLPEAGRRLIGRCGDLARALGAAPVLDRFYFLGSGPRYGLACELSLKMKEMTLSHSEPFHFMEFRHGPKAMVTSTTLVVGLVSEVRGGYERAVLDDTRALGAQVLTIGETDADVAFESALGEAARGALYLPAGQLMALERARAKGLDPDRPHNLDTVVKLDDQT